MSGGERASKGCYDEDLFGPLSYCGIGFYWAWIYTSFFEPIVSDPADFGVSGVLQTAFSLLGLLAVMVLFLFRWQWLGEKRLRTISFSGASFATLCSLAAIFAGDSTTARLAFVFLNGIGTGLLLVCWGKLYGHLTPRQSGSRVALALSIAVLLCMASHSLPSLTRAVTVACFPFISGLLFLYALRSFRSDSTYAESAAVIRLPFPLMACLLACGLSFGLITGITMLTPQSSPFVGGAILAAEAFVALFVMAFTALRGDTISFKNTYWIILPIIGLGFLLLPIFGSGQLQLSFFLARVGYTFFDVLVWIQLSDITLRSGADTARVFCAIRASLDGGVMMGNLMALVLWPVVSSNLSFVSAVLAFLLIVVFNRCLNQESIANAWGLLKKEEPGRSRWKDACRLIAQEHGMLSRSVKRRSWVLSLRGVA